ncbi:hypothetical protein LJC56_10810 [Christensenellaceae bacterium OttesenSCG-928-K19]|nr:hypothetical protein [Christensenellaceae bacterium OttesenSCG-928-K19]
MYGRRSTHEITCEVLRRMAVLRTQRKSRLRRSLILAGTACFALLACMAALPNVQRVGELQGTQTSSLTVAVDSSAGGYVLVGVAMFALGVVVALLALKWKKHKKI